MGGEWRRRTIGELCDDGLADIQTGPFGSQLHAYDYVEEGVAVVPTEAIGDRRIDHSVLPKISANRACELQRHCLKRGDILFARRGVQATGKVAFVREQEEGFLCGTGAIRLRLSEGNPELSPEFLSHVLANPASTRWFKFHAIGATMPNLNEGIVRSFPVDLPPLKEQHAIAVMLTALEDKIDLNRRMSETLEAMARALFTSWFVDFEPIRAKVEGRDPGLPRHLADLFPARLVESKLGEVPEGWEVASFGDVAESPRRTIQPDWLDPETPSIALEHMPKRSIALSEWDSADGLESNKLEFKTGEILFGKLRPYFHKVGVAPVDGVCSTDIVVVVPKSAEWFGFVLFHVSSDAFVEYTNAGATGTKMPRTSWGDMARYPVVMPTSSVSDEFTRHVRPAIDRIVVAVRESRALADLRDAMLPRLISGELRTEGATKLLAGVKS